ncbi:cytochrome b5-related protein-like [Anopheles bellator]|uniref:cytochrome b5-related protein-like n=1 Tax=Anopheles bellator TaxID=139047 RepID=UPI002648D3E1|nr:cytochrome b5-related protein-like [Anopheles bellator]XP_058057079.1 cytochrome b5-related protein-like [Anopheles bellator]XP_058057080.1 cytochrome b5-related protein-like [Anopheles bellator]
MANGYITTIAKKYPSFRDERLKTTDLWLDGKRADDGAEGLWRIHDTLYDLSDFIDHHPGGSEWIRLTKGTDITESFETHHINTRAEGLLAKYKVREATAPRAVQLTFHDDGFYRTLKRRVRDKLKDIDYAPVKQSKLIIDSMLAAAFGLAFLAIRLHSYVIGAFSGLFVCWTMIAAHNFFHQRDNWRMMTFNLAFSSYRKWRVSHAMSHHNFPNSILDLEITYFEPYLCWLPNPATKSAFVRYGSWAYGPIVYSVLLYAEFFKRIAETVKLGKNTFHLDDLVTFILPTFMYVVGTTSLWEVVKMWLFVVLVASFMFGLIGLNAAHHHPKTVHDGDRIPENIDYAVYQLAAVIDRSDTKGSLFMVLTTFGDHCLHHLFPTLDHGILPQLYPVFFETCHEFETVYREMPWLQQIIGQHKQLARIETMTYNPSEKFN